ncbi:tryptophan ABC transporter substrate-binding protein [Ligilactobacillus apodemi]|uniref:tryptophan ABC transporter substrate-binding protein n=1 Tax=Ligilactobacillus apodemi TaxID=307126 RepID=UPI00214BDBCA|nr:tryptophan ABC transporter substrate-binding protein [Ligilactobacillus apodemi]MCR1902144.1 ABC transporter substrate-binding protein [Ligilactobacillus apodemi]
MKRLISTIIILFAFLVFAFFHSTSSSKKSSIPTVGILQLTSHPALDEIHRGIIAGLKENGYVNGKTVKIDFQNAQNDQSNLKSMSQKFKDENAAVMIGIATAAAQSLANVTSTTPIVMGAISDPVGAGLVKSLSHPGGNITGVMHKEPIDRQVKLIKQIMPNVTTIGVLHTSSDDSSASEVKEFTKLAKKAGITVKDYTVTSTNDIAQVSATMASAVQAIYIPNDNTVASGFQTVLKNANQYNIPIFPSTSEMTQQGGLATVSVSQYELGKMTGQMAAEILNGKSPATMAVRYPKNGTIYLNQKQAKKLGITIPSSLLKEATKKGVVIK